MNRNEFESWDGHDEEAAGLNPLERSESGFRPADAGDPVGPTPQDASGENDDELHASIESSVELPKPSKLLAGRRRKKALSKVSAADKPKFPVSPQQKVMLLDLWNRSGLPARDFGALVGISRHTLYAWKRRFELEGPAGLEPKPTRPAGSRVSEVAKRAILMMKEANPDWGCQRISDLLTRGPALAASPNAVARVLREAGYKMEEVPTKPHPDKVRTFERAEPNQLWQTDLFSFVLKRQNRRVHLVGFMDDHSRFITAYGLHASQSSALVIEVLRSGLSSFGPPKEILTDNGAQYITWRGKSQFTRELEKRGIRQIVAKPRRPQTLGKIERFWGTMWRECIESAVFLDLEDARKRIGLFIDYYNFQRPHSGIGGLVPADRFFRAAQEVLKTLKQRVADNAIELARNGVPKKPFYLTGVAEGKPFSVHREGDRVFFRQAGQQREEIELASSEGMSESTSPEQPEGDMRDVSSADPQDSLPEAIAPDGSPQTAWRCPDAELLPGESQIDAYVQDRVQEDTAVIREAAPEESDERASLASPMEEIDPAAPAQHRCSPATPLEDASGESPGLSSPCERQEADENDS